MINVTIQNDELQDLFVTVVDLNQAVNQVVLNAVRLNRGQGSQIAIQDDSDGNGHVQWQTNLAGAPQTVRTGDASNLQDGDIVRVLAGGT
jgi:hypothetical protein